jgi:hypothetical protein
VDGALINGNLFDVLVAPSYFTIQPVRSETAMSAYPQKRKFVGMITMSALCQKQTSHEIRSIHACQGSRMAHRQFR